MDDARRDLRLGISVTLYAVRHPQLVSQAALDGALAVRPEYPFMARYIRSHPGYRGLVAS